MIIKKFLHSCLLIETEGQKLLIDPGEFCFIEGKLKPEDIPAPDIILITHEHSDHYFPEAFPKIFRNKKPQIITHERLHDLLKENGFESTAIKAGTSITVGPFTINGVQAQHGPLPVPIPENLAFIINDKLLHPGDSLTFKTDNPVEVLALPVAAPWLIVKDAIEIAVKIKPKTVIPIHDSIIKDFMLSRIYSMAQKRFTESGIEFKPLKLGETLEIPD